MRVSSVKSLKKKVWKEFSKYIRLKYTKNGIVKCYTCGKMIHWKEAQAGHGLGGRTNSILFDEELVRPQCVRCNIYLEGNYDIFHAKLIQEYGLEWFQQKLKLKNTSLQYTTADLQKLYEKYHNKVQQLLVKNDL